MSSLCLHSLVSLGNIISSSQHLSSLSTNDLTIGWQKLNPLSHSNSTPVPGARQAKASGENLNYWTLALQTMQARLSGEILYYVLAELVV